MVAKLVRFGSTAGEALARGVDVVADLVATTLGPAGRAVIVGRSHAPPIMLRNGYAITQQLDIDEADGQAGVLLMRELAWRTSDQVGDGTSTALVMARALLRYGTQAALAGLPQAALQHAMDGHRDAVLCELAAAARPVASDAELAAVATQAAGGDAEIGALVAEAHLRAGLDGVVTVEEGRGQGDHLSVEAGLHIDQGWISAHFVDDPQTQSLELDDPLILLHLGPVQELGPILPALEMISRAGRSLLVMAESVGGEALSTLVVNKQRGGLRVAAVKAPGVGLWRRLMLEDIAAATGGALIAPDLGTSLADFRPPMAGRAQRIRITQNGTTIVGGRGDTERLALRIGEIRDAIEREKHLSFDREQHRKRLARLQAAVATIRVGGVTVTEIGQRRDRATAACAAVRAAQAAGVVSGGSAALLHAGQRAEARLPRDLAGRLTGRMFAAALQAPLRAIAENAGLDGRSVVNRLAGDATICLDVTTRRMERSDVLVDPLAVLRAAVTNSVSAASRMLGVAAAVSSVPGVAGKN